MREDGIEMPRPGCCELPGTSDQPNRSQAQFDMPLARSDGRSDLGLGRTSDSKNCAPGHFYKSKSKPASLRRNSTIISVKTE